MPTVLIVDDEPAIRSVLSLAFVRAGNEVRTADGSANAMDYVAPRSSTPSFPMFRCRELMATVSSGGLRTDTRIRGRS
jgi:CheY-like chemotaxis protein